MKSPSKIIKYLQLAASVTDIKLILSGNGGLYVLSGTLIKFLNFLKPFNVAGLQLLHFRYARDGCYRNRAETELSINNPLIYFYEKIKLLLI